MKRGIRGESKGEKGERVVHLKGGREKVKDVKKRGEPRGEKRGRDVDGKRGEHIVFGRVRRKRGVRSEGRVRLWEE